VRHLSILPRDLRRRMYVPCMFKTVKKNLKLIYLLYKKFKAIYLIYKKFNKPFKSRNKVQKKYNKKSIACAILPVFTFIVREVS
jgi:hypothetical protein